MKKIIHVIIALLASAGLVLGNAAPLSAAVNWQAPTAKISFTFDDGLRSTLTQAAPVLAAHGLTGTAYITTDCIGSVGTCAADSEAAYLTWDEVATLKDTFSWEIGGHTETHPQLATDGLSAAQLEQELANSKQALAAHGFNAPNFATPYGDYDNRALEVIAKYYASHRGFWDVDDNTWPYNDYLLNNMQVQVGVSVDAVKTAIDDAIANNTWLILTFHDIQPTPNSDPDEYEYATNDLAEIAAYARTKQNANQLKNVTVQDGLIGGTNNLLENGSFENGLSNGWSTNTPTRTTLDTGNKGSYPSPTHSVFMTSGGSNTHLFSPQVVVDSTQTYMLKSFLNLKTRISGEMGYYMDEYDAAGNWISGQWFGAKTAPFVQTVNLTYTPTSAQVKKASLQVYVDANTGIQAYVDTFQWFTTLDDTTPPPAPTNMLANSNFNNGIANGWRTDNANAFSADAHSNGAPTSPTHSIKIAAQGSNAHLFAPQVTVTHSTMYTINAYANTQAIPSGEIGFYIDEYDTQGNWISGQYAYAKHSTGAETVSFSYQPTSAGIAKAGLQIIATGNSGIAGYLDEVQFLAPGQSTPGPQPNPTNLVTNGTFDAGFGGWTTNDPTNITTNNGGNGSPNNAAHSISLRSGTQNRHLFSPLVGVDAAKNYSLISFVRILTAGEVGFYIDEYDAAGNWISGQYKTGISSVGAGNATFSYTPSSVGVAQASLQVITVGGSNLNAYFDDVHWYQN